MKEQLTRSATDKMIAGVCGGVARSFGIDANIVRILWAVLSVFFLFPVVLYAVLWLILTVDGEGPTGFDDVKNAFSSKPPQA
ncbi:PspC domain-containing protein [Propionicimonas sp.]|uniref:PspC domain-containing protein n=1 Tax=Propionicimonas sp. TaxID=1955623 RepID=UPI0017AF26B0|nr:PspC domain-containing protein [Propionicimonas sp.]MBU3977019.1 PspC domain-containing protein [Actinomycetota bacterium]MBA3020590.1 PspC domain-containing protein [Propionicimonas sp.]MBU3984959.1 PspC domain-containing protein [Actinomycetota bacterium]MBU4007084.1 PspC domain-containing protein [Actinomycetota bacterium]MBU4064837.1 PspC domain-containing protein [Actinomycetota bacterium]